MKPRPHRSTRRGLVIAFALACTASFAAAPAPVAVFTETFNGYTRTRQPDRTYAPEAYVFGEGGSWSRPIADPASERVKFLDVARAAAGPLARLNYLPARKSSDARLLILVFWGATLGSRGQDSSLATDRVSAASAAFARATGQSSETDRRDPTAANAADEFDSALIELALANDARDALDDRNARILGYTESVNRARFVPNQSFAQDIFAEIGNNRYYVVLQAYDFATARQHKKLKPLWTARISIDESGNDFAASLDHMLRSAQPFLGLATDGLKRHVVPEGRVDLGPAEVLETTPAK